MPARASPRRHLLQRTPRRRRHKEVPCPATHQPLRQCSRTRCWEPSRLIMTTPTQTSFLDTHIAALLHPCTIMHDSAIEEQGGHSGHHLSSLSWLIISNDFFLPLYRRLNPLPLFPDTGRKGLLLYSKQGAASSGEKVSSVSFVSFLFVCPFRASRTKHDGKENLAREGATMLLAGWLFIYSFFLGLRRNAHYKFRVVCS